jgi:hypothetical protein
MIWFYCVMSALGGSFLSGLLWLLFGSHIEFDSDESGFRTMVFSVVLALIVVAIAGWVR